MMELDLSKEETADIQASLKRYMAEEFDIDMGDLQANLLLRFVLTEIGPFVYNRAIADAERLLAEKVADLPGVLFEEGLTYWKKGSKKKR
jgi:uncharacterized protein (DUF2164 family)